MSVSIKKCSSCKSYSLEPECNCGTKTSLPRPPKFSLTDKYASYRRDVKKEDLAQRGLY